MAVPALRSHGREQASRTAGLHGQNWFSAAAQGQLADGLARMLFLTLSPHKLLPNVSRIIGGRALAYKHHRQHIRET